jgi:hypothetical protein
MVAYSSVAYSSVAYSSVAYSSVTHEETASNWRSIAPDDSNVNIGFRPCWINSAGLGLQPLLPSLPKDWQRAMMEIAKRTHAVFIRHPWALVAMLSAPPGLNAMRHMEQCLEALAETSMTEKQKITLLATVDDFVFGHALREAATDATIDIEFATAQLATGAFPLLAEVFRGGRINASKDRFERGLRVLLEGTRT